MDRQKGRNLEANKAAITTYGYSRNELIKVTLHDLRAAQARTLTSAQMDKASYDVKRVGSRNGKQALNVAMLTLYYRAIALRSQYEYVGRMSFVPQETEHQESTSSVAVTWTSRNRNGRWGQAELIKS